jgi:hypothetical protein
MLLYQLFNIALVSQLTSCHNFATCFFVYELPHLPGLLLLAFELS